MTEMTPFERQVENELQGMVGPIPRFDAIGIAEAAVATSRPARRWPKVFEAFGLAAAASLLLLVGVAVVSQLLPTRGEYVVAPDGSADFVSVAEAVAAAQDGDAVLLMPGTYFETIEVTTDIEIRGMTDDGEVVFEVGSDGPAFRLRGVDATIADITFLSRPWEGNEERRPIIWVDGGAPTIENLVAHADAPEEFVFIRLYATDEGAVVRDNESSGIIRANRGAQALITRNRLLSRVDGAAPAGITAEREDTVLDVEDNELNFIESFGSSVELAGNDIHGGRPVNLVWDGGGEDASIEYGNCAVTGSDSLVMNSGQVRDTETGVCGSPRITGGEIHDNGVGVWSDLGFSSGEPGEGIAVTTVSGATIRDNDVGARTAPYSKLVLEDVTFCGNEVDTENHGTSTIEQSGSAECPVPRTVGLPNDELTVATDGTATFDTIAEAVAAAADGDVVRLEPGIYEETVVVTRDIEIRGQDGVVFHIPSDGPAFELADADALISDITFVSQPRDDSDKRRPAVDATGGAPVLERLTAHADEPVRFDFVRLYETEPGAVVRDSISSGVIRANRGAEALIEGNILVRQEPDAPGAGVALLRRDTFLRIEGNELNFIDVLDARAEIADNDIHGARPLVPQAVNTSSFREGACGVSARPGEVYLTANRIHDNDTGICGAFEVDGGEISHNVIGVWSASSNHVNYEEADKRKVDIRDVVIRENDIGIRAAPGSETTLLRTALCENGVDVEGEEAATVATLEPAECES